MVFRVYQTSGHMLNILSSCCCSKIQRASTKSFLLAVVAALHLGEEYLEEEYESPVDSLEEEYRHGGVVCQNFDSSVKAYLPSSASCSAVNETEVLNQTGEVVGTPEVVSVPQVTSGTEEVSVAEEVSAPEAEVSAPEVEVSAPEAEVSVPEAEVSEFGGRLLSEGSSHQRKTCSVVTKAGPQREFVMKTVGVQVEVVVPDDQC